MCFEKLMNKFLGIAIVGVGGYFLGDMLGWWGGSSTTTTTTSGGSTPPPDPNAAKAAADAIAAKAAADAQAAAASGAADAAAKAKAAADAAAAAAALKAQIDSCASTNGRWDSIASYCIPNFTQAPAPPALRRAVLSATAFAQKLQQLAGGNIPLNIDQWDYYTKQIDPNAVVDSDHFGVARGPQDSFYATQFVDMRTSGGLALPSGLSGYTPTMRFANRGNYRRRRVA